MKPTLAAVALASTVALAAQPLEEPAAIAGYVLTPEGVPVSGGAVALNTVGTGRVVNIGPDGRFRVDGVARGVHEITVSAARFMPTRLRVVVPASGLLMLPPIHLAAGSYLHTIFLTPGAQPIESPAILRQSYDLTGERINEAPAGWGRGDAGPGPTTIIGPLPVGVTTLAVDVPPFARMRLRDVQVSGDVPVIKWSPVRLQPGSVLHVDVVGANGAAVPNHDVHLEEPVSYSPLPYEPVRTNAEGRATFERLARGRYYLRMAAEEPCVGRISAQVGRSIDMPADGTVTTRIVIGGSLSLRFMSGGVPMGARTVHIAPETPSVGLPSWLRHPDSPTVMRHLWISKRRESPCNGATDANGRLAMPNIPPGPTRVTLRIGSSIWSRTFRAPAPAREVVIDIPSGVLPVRVVDESTRAPINGAEVRWLSGGAQVEANTSATGEALLEGVADRAGTLSAEAPQYPRRTEALARPPNVLYELALERSADRELACRVLTRAGRPLDGAVVELKPHDGLHIAQVATTDRAGIVRFDQVPEGAYRVVARAPRHVASAVNAVPTAAGSGEMTTIVLRQGRRVVIEADGKDDGVHTIRIRDSKGASLDGLLDAASERVIQAGGRTSLGPLPPGDYSVELRSESGNRKAQVRIENRDVRVVFR